MSLDGKIATWAGDSKLSSEEDLIRVHELRASSDAIMVGVRTILEDDPKLTVTRVKGENPTRIIVDSAARTPVTARAITVSPETPTIIAVTRRASKNKIERLEKAGAKIILVGHHSHVDLRVFCRKLRSMGVKKLLVEGGGRLNWSMLSQSLVDEVRVAVVPVIVGGAEAVTLVEGRGAKRVDEGVGLRLKDARRYGKDLVLFYKVLGRRLRRKK